MKQRSRYFQYAAFFFFLVLPDTGNFAAQEQGRIIIIRGCPFLSTFPDIYILDAGSRSEVIQLFAESDDNSIEAAVVAATEAETLMNQEDTAVGILHEFHGSMTEKPWNGLGLYFVFLEDVVDGPYLSRAKKNMGTGVIVMNFSEFSRLGVD